MDPSNSVTNDVPRIENIKIIELLGKGGMSLVYKAKQIDLDRLVAVKVLAKISSEEGIKRFKQEARHTSSLDHPYIVKTIAFGISQDKQPYLIMEYLDGHSLADELKQNGRLHLQKFQSIFLPVLSALGHAHEAGLIHRDIKPGNIMLCSEANGEVAKLVDFGIAKAYLAESESPNLTKSNELIGSPAYMSPEHCLGQKLDGRSDLYSLATVMYECISGEQLFSGDSPLEIMQNHCSAAAPTVSELSRKIDIRKELANVICWGLNKDPAKRPQTAAEFANELREVLEKITLDKVPRLKKDTSRLLKLPGFFIASAAAIVLVTAFAFTLTYFKNNKHNRSSELGLAGLNDRKRNTMSEKETNVRVYLSKLALEFDQVTGEFTGQDSSKRLAELDSLILAKNGHKQLRGAFAYVAGYFVCKIHEQLHSPVPVRLSALKQALKFSKDASGRESRESADIRLHIATTECNPNNFPEVIAEVTRSINLLSKSDTPSLDIPDSLKIARHRKTVGDCYFHLGEIAEDLGKARQAVAYYDQAIAVPNSQPRWQIPPYGHKLALLRREGRTTEANKCLEDFINSAIPYLQAGSDISRGDFDAEAKNAVSMFGEMGERMVQAGFPEDAIKLFSAERAYAKQIKWTQVEQEATQRLKGLRGK